MNSEWIDTLAAVATTFYSISSVIKYWTEWKGSVLSEVDKKVKDAVHQVWVEYVAERKKEGTWSPECKAIARERAYHIVRHQVWVGRLWVGESRLRRMIDREVKDVKMSCGGGTKHTSVHTSV